MKTNTFKVTIIAGSLLLSFACKKQSNSKEGQVATSPESQLNVSGKAGPGGGGPPTQAPQFVAIENPSTTYGIPVVRRFNLNGSLIGSASLAVAANFPGATGAIAGGISRYKNPTSGTYEYYTHLYHNATLTPTTALQQAYICKININTFAILSAPFINDLVTPLLPPLLSNPIVNRHANSIQIPNNVSSITANDVKISYGKFYGNFLNGWSGTSLLVSPYSRVDNFAFSNQNNFSSSLSIYCVSYASTNNGNGTAYRTNSNNYNLGIPFPALNSTFFGGWDCYDSDSFSECMTIDDNNNYYIFIRSTCNPNSMDIYTGTILPNGTLSSSTWCGNVPFVFSDVDIIL